MFRLFGRILNVIREYFGEQVRDLEWKKPEAVLEDALSKKKQGLEKFYGAVAELETLKDEQINSLKRKQTQLERIEVQILHASKTGDHEKGIMLTMKKNQLERNIKEEASSLEKRISDLSMAKKKLHDAQYEVETFSMKKKELVSEIKMLQAEKNIGQITQRFFNDSNVKAYNELKHRVEIERNKDIIYQEINGTFYTDDVDYIEAKKEFEKLSYKKLENRNSGLKVIDVTETIKQASK
jgi:phage shock protein A